MSPSISKRATFPARYGYGSLPGALLGTLAVRIVGGVVADASGVFYMSTAVVSWPVAWRWRGATKEVETRDLDRVGSSISSSISLVAASQRKPSHDYSV